MLYTILRPAHGELSLRVKRKAVYALVPTGAPALAELGHPDVASGRYSWAVRARMVVLKPSCREPSGRRLDLPYGVTAMPSTQRSFLASCLRYLTPVFPPPLPRTLFPSRAARGSFPAAQSAPYLAPQGREKRKGMGRGRYVPSRHQGVRSGARTGSLQEQGTYRLYPLNLNSK